MIYLFIYLFVMVWFGIWRNIITKFAADATLSNHTHLKVYYAAEKRIFKFKGPRLFKLKKEYPSEQWQVISFRLIPLKTPVSFRWTVPLKDSLTRVRGCFDECTVLRNFL
jgi:hypothetical protein